MENLSDCILLMIFSNVSQRELCLSLRMTCKRWWRLSHDQHLWKTVYIPALFSNERLLALLSCIHEQVEEIDCGVGENLDENVFDSIADLKFPRLKKLDVPWTISPFFSDDIFLKLSLNCPKLEELSNVKLSDDSLLIQSRFPRLKVLHDVPTDKYDGINQQRQHWRTGINNVATRCPNVHLYSCTFGKECLDEDGFEFIATSFPNLKELEIRECSLTDKGFERYFYRKKSGLTRLALDRPGRITDRALVIIADNCPDLLKLMISPCANITNKGIKYLVQKCPKLTEIHLNSGHREVLGEQTKFTNLSMRYISLSCPNLRVFSLSRPTEVTHVGIKYLVNRCRFLRCLLMYGCPAIDDRCLLSLVNLPYLRALVLQDCRSFTPKGILNFLLRAPNLNKLELYAKSEVFCGDLKDLALEVKKKMKTCRPNVVTEITVNGVGSDFLQLLAMVCPLLEDLSIDGHDDISVASLNTVVSNAKRLRYISVDSCKDLDDSFFETVINDAKELCTLLLGSASENFDIDMLVDVIRACPSLKKISIDNVVGDEDVLRDAAEEYHGGQCSMHVFPEFESFSSSYFTEPKSIKLTFTPIKYIDSVSSF